MLKKALELFSQGKSLILLVLLGSISWSLTVVKSGLVYSYGMGFWGANGHDGIWHLALIESLVKGSLSMPIFAGENLKNYHIGFDLLIAIINKLTNLPVGLLYFQIVPPILAVLIGILTYKFVYLWTKSKKAGLWATFFVYFGGSFGWAIGKGESAFWSQQQISTLVNPPFAMSLIFILIGLIFLLKNKYVFAALSFGVLIEVKAYAGILVLGSLAVIGFWRLLKEKKWDYLLIFLGTLVLSLILYFPLNRNSTNLIVFQPFWFLETMMQLTDRVGWTKFGEAMINYRVGGVWIKAFLAYGFAFLVFILGNFATRILFLLKKVKLDNINIFICLIILAGVIISTLFLQKGTPWNTIQFFYYSLFFSGILAGIVVSEFSFWLSIIIVLLTTPTTFLALYSVYLPSRPPAKVSNEELSALSFLSRQPDGVVLTYPFDSVKAKEAEANPPRPLYLYDSTAYVSAFSKKPTYLEDEVNLDITGYDWRTRLAGVQLWYKENNQDKVREFLKTNNIKYIYWLKGQRAFLGETQLGITRIFENKEVDIYRVD